MNQLGDNDSDSQATCCACGAAGFEPLHLVGADARVFPWQRPLGGLESEL